MSSILHRRRFLQAAGLGAGSLFLPSLGRRGQAQSADTPPMRLVILYHGQGVPHPNWEMRPANLPADRAWEYSLVDHTEEQMSRCLRPLHRHRRKMTVVDGLSLATAYADPHGDAHAKGSCSSLTGGVSRLTYQGNKSLATYPSFDQLLAVHLRRQEPLLTDLVTLEYGVDAGNFHYCLYRPGTGGAPVQPVAYEGNPQLALARLFPPPTPVRAARPDLMAELAGLYDAQAARLSADDQRKLSAHRDLLRDTERRLRFLQTLDCGRPSLTGPLEPAPTLESMNARTRSFFDIAAVALSCRVSRVVSLQWADLPVEAIGGTGSVHHDYAHESVLTSLNADKYPRALEGMTHYAIQFARWVADLCDVLDAIPEGNGTLLDHTIVLWAGELADGAHGLDGWPAVMVGGGARLRTGRYLHVAHATPTTSVSQWDRDDDVIGLPHNHLLVSIAQAMGVDLDTVGMSSAKARKAGVRDIDLRGPLPGLA